MSRHLAALRAREFGSLLTLSLAAQLIVLLPVANTPYWGDDNSNSYIAGYLHWAGKSWWPFIGEANTAQWVALGRPMPLGVLQTYGVFYVLQDRLLYKVLLIALTLIGSGMIGLLVRRLGASPAVAALTAALPAVSWQLHLLHDPLLSYAGLMQAVVIYAAGAMLAFLAWLRRGGTWRLVAVMVLTAAACVTYESSYLLAIGLIFIAWQERGGSLVRAVSRAWPGLAVAALFVAVAAIRALSMPLTSGYHLSTAPGVIAVAWGKILVSGLPIVGWSATPGPRSLTAAAWGPALFRGMAVAALLFPLLWAAARSDAPRFLRDRRALLTVVGITLVVMLTPALLTAVAPQYQHQVQWGWGYLPMFFSVFGWALLGALGVGALLARLPRRPAVALGAVTIAALLGGASAALNAQASSRVVDYMKPAERSRSLLEAGFQHGVLDAVPTYSTILWYWPEIVIPRGTWAPGAMNLEAWTREFVDRPLTMHLIAPPRTGAEVCTDASLRPTRCRLLGTPAFWLRTRLGSSGGYVAIDQIAKSRWSATSDTLTALTAPGSRPVVFVEDPRVLPRSVPPPFVVTVRRGEPLAGRIDVPSARLRILREGSGWILARLPPQPPFVASSIRVTRP